MPLIVLVAILSQLFACVAQDPAASQPATENEPPAPATTQPSTPMADPKNDAEAVDVLKRAAEAHAKINTLTALIRYAREQALTGGEEIRRGTANFRFLPDVETKQFCVAFTTLIIDGGLDEQSRDYIFDGRFLVERNNDDHQFFKHELVRPGETMDPLDVNGPFPLPIRQNPKRVLRRFRVKMGAMETEGRLKGAIVIHLTRRRASDEIESIDLWYNPESLIPYRARVTEDGGDIMTVDLAEVELNEAVDPAMFSTETPPPTAGWHIEVKPFKDGRSEGEGG